MRKSIMRAYCDLGASNCLEDGCNPVKSRSLDVTGYNTKGMVDVIEGEDDGGSGDPCRSAAVHNQEVHLLSSKFSHFCHEPWHAHYKTDCQLVIMKRKLA
jgi:hypothetical protein